MRRPLDWFPPALAAAVGLAWIAPGPGAHGGLLHPEIANKVGVALIFLLSGVALPFSALRAGTARWPLHLLVQTMTFVGFPLVGLAVFVLGEDRLGLDVRLGFVYLCALPSTVSSAVALTAAAGGDVAVAGLYDSLSSILGGVVTQLWLSQVLTAGLAPLPLGRVVLDLVEWLILPLALGQLCRPLLGAWAARHKRRLAVLDRLIILFLVYASFCDAVAGGIWSRYGLAAVAIVLVGSAAILVLALWSMLAATRALGLARGERIAAVFIGATKSLAAGVPMAQLIFGSDPALGMILLPIMLYHPLQLIACGALASRWAREGAAPAPS
jgi:sodium/bile acid cotransporter 7